MSGLQSEQLRIEFESPRSLHVVDGQNLALTEHEEWELDRLVETKGYTYREAEAEILGAGMGTKKPELVLIGEVPDDPDLVSVREAVDAAFEEMRDGAGMNGFMLRMQLGLTE